MNEYYAMITPGHAGDWGHVILIDARVGAFIESAIRFTEEYGDTIEIFKEEFSLETFSFVKKELDSEGLDDKEFVVSISGNWDSLMSDNYYDFKVLESTLIFESIASLIEYVNENDLEVIADFN